MCAIRLIITRQFSQAIFFGLLLLGAGAAHAQLQTHIFIQNDSSQSLSIKDIVISGDKLNKKAWKKGESTIAQGTREKVVTINRSGKLNWMDPTPRFIEPGKTVVFSTIVNLEPGAGNSDFQLKQKLLGTGKATKMWHSAGIEQVSLEWVNDLQNYSAIWAASESKTLAVQYRAYKEKSNVHIEYVFSDWTE